jgi:hypothetical protein
MNDKFIVAEISKNWMAGSPVSATGLIAQQFEAVINRNAERGYRLLSFTLDRVITAPGDMNETIIAVFERIERPHPPIPNALQTNPGDENY